MLFAVIFALLIGINPAHALGDNHDKENRKLPVPVAKGAAPGEYNSAFERPRLVIDNTSRFRINKPNESQIEPPQLHVLPTQYFDLQYDPASPAKSPVMDRAVIAASEIAVRPSAREKILTSLSISNEQLAAAAILINVARFSGIAVNLPRIKQLVDLLQMQPVDWLRLRGAAALPVLAALWQQSQQQNQEFYKAEEWTLLFQKIESRILDSAEYKAAPDESIYKPAAGAKSDLRTAAERSLALIMGRLYRAWIWMIPTPFSRINDQLQEQTFEYLTKRPLESMPKAAALIKVLPQLDRERRAELVSVLNSYIQNLFASDYKELKIYESPASEVFAQFYFKHSEPAEAQTFMTSLIRHLIEKPNPSDAGFERWALKQARVLMKSDSNYRNYLQSWLLADKAPIDVRMRVYETLRKGLDLNLNLSARELPFYKEYVDLWLVDPMLFTRPNSEGVLLAYLDSMDQANAIALAEKWITRLFDYRRNQVVPESVQTLTEKLLQYLMSNESGEKRSNSLTTIMKQYYFSTWTGAAPLVGDCLGKLLGVYLSADTDRQRMTMLFDIIDQMQAPAAGKLDLSAGFEADSTLPIEPTFEQTQFIKKLKTVALNSNEQRLEFDRYYLRQITMAAAKILVDDAYLPDHKGGGSRTPSVYAQTVINGAQLLDQIKQMTDAHGYDSAIEQILLARWPDIKSAYRVLSDDAEVRHHHHAQNPFHDLLLRDARTLLKPKLSLYCDGILRTPLAQPLVQSLVDGPKKR